jgi:hypothetical protein
MLLFLANYHVVLYLYTKLLHRCISKKTPRNFVLYVEKLQFIVVLVVLLKLIPSSTLIQTNTIITNYFEPL